jgi:hypothetical protein
VPRVATGSWLPAPASGRWPVSSRGAVAVTITPRTPPMITLIIRPRTATALIHRRVVSRGRRMPPSWKVSSMVHPMREARLNEYVHQP